MTLFESDSQYREKLTIWRVLSVFPLYAPLAEGRVWRWFAVNIPMDLAGIDILSPKDFRHRQPFSRLVDDLDEFFERQGERPRKSFNQIVYCKNCRCQDPKH